jgi:hypothetical protein
VPPRESEILTASLSLSPTSPEHESASRLWKAWASDAAALKRCARGSSPRVVVETLVAILTAEQSPVEAVSAAAAALADASAKDGALKAAVVADSRALVPVAARILQRVVYIPEVTAFAIFDLLRVVLAESPAADALKIADFLAQDGGAWSVIAFLCSQNECCAMASGLHIAAANLGSWLIDVYVRNKAPPSVQLDALATSSGESLVPADGAALRNAALESVPAALVSLFSRAATREYLPLGPIASSPATSALHLLHSIAGTGNEYFEKFLAGAPPALVTCVANIVVSDSAPARARLSSARFLYLASTLMNEKIGDNFVAANLPAVAVSILMHALPPSAAATGVDRMREAVHLFMSLALRNLIMTPAAVRHGVRPGDPLPDDVELRGPPGELAPPRLPPGAALPAIAGPPIHRKVALWGSLETLSRNSAHAAALIVAVLSFAANRPATVKGATSGLRAIVATNGPELERFIVRRLSATDATQTTTASRAAFLLWAVAAERARVTSSRWSHTRINLTNWSGEKPADDAWPLPALPSGWKRLETLEGFPYYASAEKRATQWAVPPAADAAVGRPSVGLPFEDNESGLFALRSLFEEGILNRSKTSAFIFEAAALPVRLVIAAVAAEALSEAPFICTTGDHRVGDGIHIDGVDGAQKFFHWPHIPASNAPAPLLELGQATRTFLHAALASLDADTTDSTPISLAFNKSFAASVGRCSRSGISDLPAAFAAIAVRIFSPTTPATPFQPPPLDSTPEAVVAEFVEQARPIIDIKWVLHPSNKIEDVQAALESFQAVKALFIAKETDPTPLLPDNNAAAKLPSTDVIEATGTPFQYAWDRESAYSTSDVLRIVDEAGTKTGLRMASLRLEGDMAIFRAVIEESIKRITERPH